VRVRDLTNRRQAVFRAFHWLGIVVCPLSQSITGRSECSRSAARAAQSLVQEDVGGVLKEADASMVVWADSIS
jgi:hypothetical protein